MIVLSFDPGETTGWCVQNPDKIIDKGQARGFSELMEVVDEWIDDIDEIVAEDYVILGSKAMAHTGSRGVAMQVIGYIKTVALRNHKPLTMYNARLKPIQQKATQQFPRGAHSKNHWVDAYNHGRWHLIQNKLADTALMAMKKKEMGITNGR